MRAVAVQTFGAPDGMAMVDVPAPEPGPGQVTIAVEAIGVGGVDAMIRRGTLSGYGFGSGHILGSEVAGTVTAVGVDVEPSWIGERVWAFTGTGGGYAEQAVAAVDHLERIPAGLTNETAVALGSSGAVAHFALQHAHFAPGESVLIRGAAGSIGLLAVQLARTASAIAVTTSSPDRGRRLRELGATHVLDRSGTGDGPATYDVILDVIAGPDLPSFLPKLSPNGRLVVLGAVAGPLPAGLTDQLMQSFQKSLSLATFSLDTIPVPARALVRRDQFAAAARGELDAVVHDVLGLDEAAKAHEQMDAGQVFGRIVLKP
ncbi:zinc-binding dehydrogenase [Kribbella sp. NPDC056345]|uniref:zinc-binding dehydrogenase n=1 Tax=Kribbella sp. NPDC056345 TaxID=3345789 RepID=UPI0035D7D87D